MCPGKQTPAPHGVSPHRPTTHTHTPHPFPHTTAGRGCNPLLRLHPQGHLQEPQQVVRRASSIIVQRTHPVRFPVLSDPKEGVCFPCQKATSLGVGLGERPVFGEMEGGQWRGGIRNGASCISSCPDLRQIAPFDALLLFLLPPPSKRDATTTQRPPRPTHHRLRVHRPSIPVILCCNKIDTDYSVTKKGEAASFRVRKSEGGHFTVYFGQCSAAGVGPKPIASVSKNAVR